MSSVRAVVHELVDVFERSHSKYEANVRSQRVLEQASRDPSFLTGVLEQFVSSPGALDVGNYPVVGIIIDSNPHFGLVANCWIPLPGRETHISTKAIHHHGDLLLSTATIFGPGYEHWMFTLPKPHGTSGGYSMELIEAAPHPLHHVSFVDAWTAHAPLYPADLSITLALWTSRHPTRWPDRLKRLPPFKGREATFRKLALKLGLKSQLELKVVESFDYYPSERGFEVMRERQEFGRGPNEDHCCSVFHVLQKTGNAQLARAVRKSIDEGRVRSSRATVEALLQKLERDVPIEGRLSRGHFGVPFANFTRDDIKRALATTAPAKEKGVQHGSEFVAPPHHQAAPRAGAH